MASKTLSENINQAISDFGSIKQAIIDKGVEVPSGTPTSQYGTKIGEIQSGGGSDEDFISVIERTATNPTLPSGLTKIGDYAFYSCTKLALTSLPNSLTSIGNNAFQYCTGLTEITFKSKPSTLSTSAFKGCTNLTTIRVPWAEGEVSGAPFGATNATIVYNYTETE